MEAAERIKPRHTKAINRQGKPAEFKSPIIFESMTRRDIVLACFWSFIGRSVFYLKKPHPQARSFLAWALRNKFLGRRIKHLAFSWKEDIYDGLWTDRAFDAIDPVFDKLSASCFVKLLTAKLGSLAQLAIKKELAMHLARFFYLNQLLGHLSSYFNSPVKFVPSANLNFNYFKTKIQQAVDYSFFRKLTLGAGIYLEEHKYANFTFLNLLQGWFSIIAEILLRHLYMTVIIMRSFFIALKNLVSREKLQSWSYGVMIMSRDRQFQNGIEGLDFLIDGKLITKKQVVFIPHTFVKLTKCEIDFINERKLNYITSLNSFYLFGPWLQMFKAAFLSLFATKVFLLKTAHSLAKGVALWESFSSKVHLDNVIGHHDVSVSALCRNIILEKKHKTRSYLYMDSNNFSNYFAPKSSQVKYRFIFYSFMHYTCVVYWNKEMEKILTSMHNQISQHFQAGCLWSTFIKRYKKLDQQDFKVNPTIAVFDSSYRDHCISNPRTAYFFYRGIWRMLEELADLRIIMKPKKTKNYYELMLNDKSMFAAIKALENHPRCQIMDYNTARCQVLAGVDLVIAYPFTSSAFEAICAGIPGIYFDVTGSFSNSLYQDCGIVASNQQDLIEKVKHFLSISEFNFNQWRLNYKSVFDDFLDSRGLDRFIEKLAGKI